MKTKYSGFSLLEVIITTVTISILVGVLFSIFTTISRLAVKIQLERGVHNDLIFTMQTIQNIVDEGEYSLTGYDLNSLENTYGFSDELLLSGSSYEYKLLRSCAGTGETECSLVLERFDSFLLRTDEFTLTDTSRVNIDKFYIKVIPYGDQSIFENIQHQGFWLFLDVSVPQFDDDKRWFRVNQRIETFFNIRQY